VVGVDLLYVPLLGCLKLANRHLKWAQIRVNIGGINNHQLLVTLKTWVILFILCFASFLKCNAFRAFRKPCGVLVLATSLANDKSKSSLFGVSLETSLNILEGIEVFLMRARIKGAFLEI